MTITRTRDLASPPAPLAPAASPGASSAPAAAPADTPPGREALPSPAARASDGAARERSTALEGELRWRYIDPHVLRSRAANAAERANLARGLDVDGLPHRGDLVMRIDSARRPLPPFERGMITSLEGRASSDVRKLAVLAELLTSGSFRALGERERVEMLGLYSVHLDTLASLRNVPFRTDVVASESFRALQPWDQGLVQGAMASVMPHRDRLEAIRAVFEAPSFRALPRDAQSRLLAGMTATVETPARLANQARLAEVLSLPGVRALPAAARAFVEGLLVSASDDGAKLDVLARVLGSERFRRLGAEACGAALVAIQAALADPTPARLADLAAAWTTPARVRPGIR